MTAQKKKPVEHRVEHVDIRAQLLADLAAVLRERDPLSQAQWTTLDTGTSYESLVEAALLRATVLLGAKPKTVANLVTIRGTVVASGTKRGRDTYWFDFEASDSAYRGESPVRVYVRERDAAKIKAGQRITIRLVAT